MDKFVLCIKNHRHPDPSLKRLQLNAIYRMERGILNRGRAGSEGWNPDRFEKING